MPSLFIWSALYFKSVPPDTILLFTLLEAYTSHDTLLMAHVLPFNCLKLEYYTLLDVKILYTFFSYQKHCFILSLFLWITSN
ncbi:hypothetical protein C0J52_26685 [Blattella germanica]|nr:hypothetical protein C0J52_26685 [Blattella germanica]